MRSKRALFSSSGSTIHSRNLNDPTYVFNEAAANDGSLDAGAYRIGLAHDTFSVTSGPLTHGVNYTITNLPAGLIPTLTVDSTGTIATLTLSGNAAAHASLDNITGLQFTFADSAFTQSTAAQVAQAVAYTGNVDINFIDSSPPAPGGVINGMAFWLKADAGVTNGGDGTPATAWADQSPNGIDTVSPTESGLPLEDPVYRAVGSNFNPTIDFGTDAIESFTHDGAQPQPAFSLENSGLVNNNGTGYPLKSMSFHLKPTAASASGYRVIYSQGDAWSVGTLNGGLLTAWVHTDPIFPVPTPPTTPLTDDTDYIITVVFDQDATDEVLVYVNGAFAFAYSPTTGGTPTPMGSNSVDIGLGSWTQSARLYNNITSGNVGDNLRDFEGIISEVIQHNLAYTVAERTQIETYLALKYGISLAVDYVNSNGLLLWDTDGAQSAYSNDIAGIGRDDASALNQKQSKSVNDDALVTIGLSTIEATNAANTATFAADKDFFIWGNDDGAIAWQTSEAPTGQKRLTREWLIDETGLTNTTQRIRIPDDSSGESTTLPAETSTVYLLVDADGVFGDAGAGTVSVPMTLNGGYWEADYTFNDVWFFTFATEAAVTLPVKVFLQGAYDTTTDTMRDNLRTLTGANGFPQTSPYGGSEMTTGAVLGVSDPNNAIVDWVNVELRDGSNNTSVVATVAALVQRDGDVVDASDGTSTLSLSGVTPGNYFIAVHHRNHLAAMTNSTVALSGSTATVDFTTMTDAQTYGSNAQVLLETGIYGLWAGNVNDSLIRTGAGNDLDPLVNTVLDDPGNVNDNTNYIVSGYYSGDLNMDGQVIAAGPNNDVTRVLSNIINHPANSGGNANHIVQEQLP